ncbi:PREDICTED: RNA polymerase-associated protein RTF1 homolog [Fragaria vesca subsp. vesca]
MADLDDLLLEAAGRTSSGRKSRHSHSSSKRRRDDSYSDGGSDSRGDDSDDGRGYASRKPSGSQVPLKKRLDPSEVDDERDSQDEGDYNDSGSDRGGESNESDVGSDLYKDEDDRRKLAEMSELQRELILSDRAQKKDDKSLKEKFRPKWDKGKATQSRKVTPPLPSSRVRSSARSADRAAAKDDALNELRAKRLKQQDPEAHRKLRDVSRGSVGSKNFSHTIKKSFSAVRRSSSSQSDSESRSHSDDEGSSADDAIDSDDERGNQGLTFEDIKEITIRRSRLAKWLMEPFFEELIVGCFVRVGIGKTKSGRPIYRLCSVRNVDSSDPDRQYKLENKTTHKYLNVVWGNENSAARWQMAMVSDSLPLEEEYDQWVREVEKNGGRLPSKEDVLEKKEAIKKTNTFVYSAETVKQMIQEKKSASSRPLNIALEKDRLRRELEIAQSKHDDAEVERIKARLEQLEARRQSQGKDSKAVRLAEMNRKNRVDNPDEQKDDAEANAVAAESLAEVETNGTGGVVAVRAGLEATAAALEAAAGAGKLIDTMAPVDQGTSSNPLHNFELPISLATLQKFGGPQGAQEGFMARKQRIEATVGVRVPEDDGRRHALTLSVSDYKRRRGLL